MMARHMTTNESSIFLLTKGLYSVKHTSDDLQWAINFLTCSLVFQLIKFLCSFLNSYFDREIF
jgi:hypothetical protein